MAFATEWHQRRHEERLAEGIAILGGKCAHCGSSGHLEFDHVDRVGKVANVTSLTFARREKWLAEVVKCQLLCRSCHERKSILEAGKRPAKDTHGTESSYRYCRCDLCKAGKAKAFAAYKAKRRLAQQKVGA